MGQLYNYIKTFYDHMDDFLRWNPEQTEMDYEFERDNWTTFYDKEITRAQFNKLSKKEQKRYHQIPSCSRKGRYRLIQTTSKSKNIYMDDIDNKYKSPSINRIESFVHILQKQKSNLRVLIRWSKGTDISAACGQLATENEN